MKTGPGTGRPVKQTNKQTNKQNSRYLETRKDML